ncbi:hypothetical protein EYC84_005154 [Monilinia fructicola]|uniref:NADP-dependent oxidoreductase domain-containing protein n=1 Tax=Monilinia fructicola TaxID=38448 RepID=A0A5M9JY51_MONFR|nr:hypothetical protein EYC84_005154 [Monilinia fructicola]
MGIPRSYYYTTLQIRISSSFQGSPTNEQLLSPLSTLRAGLNSSRTRCIQISPRLSHLPKQITRLSSTSTPKLSNILQPSIVNSGTASEITIPRIIYSTARKGEKTERLVYEAIQAGYRGIETGAEPLKYEEKLVGDGIRRAIEKGVVERNELYVQTTFAPPEGHNLHAIPSSVKGEKTLEEVMTRLPYSFSSPIAEQIHASIASSLKNLETSDDERDTYIDCLILRSPYPTRAESIEAWKVLSTYVPHPIRSLGSRSRQLMGIGEESAGAGRRREKDRPIRIREHVQETQREGHRVRSRQQLPQEGHGIPIVMVNQRHDPGSPERLDL